MRKPLRLSITAGCAALLLYAAVAPADWPQIHFDSNNSANIGSAATIANVNVGAQWTTGPQDLSSGTRPIIADGKVFAVAMQSSPAERLWIKSFDKTTGTLGDESADLDIGDASIFGTSFMGGDSTSVNLETVSAPVVTGTALFFGSGSTMYRLSTTDLTEDWSTQIDSSNTDATGTYGIVNSSPSLGSGQVFIRTYPLNFGAIDESQIVAFDQTSGAVTWYAKAGGRGTTSPLYIDLGASQIVVTDTQSTTGNVELAAYDAGSTGVATPTWTISAALAEPTDPGFGPGNHGQWTDFVYDSATQKIFGVTSNFSGGRVYRVDAATGTLDWQVDTDGADAPPVMVGGSLYVLNHANSIVRYATADGSVTGNPVAVISSFVFRDYMAATTDGVYLAKDGDGLRFFTPDITNSVTTASTKTGSNTGPVAIDSATGYVYAHDGNDGIEVVTGVSSVQDWKTLD